MESSWSPVRRKTDLGHVALPLLDTGEPELAQFDPGNAIFYQRISYPKPSLDKVNNAHIAA